MRYAEAPARPRRREYAPPRGALDALCVLALLLAAALCVLLLLSRARLTALDDECRALAAELSELADENARARLEYELCFPNEELPARISGGVRFSEYFAPGL